MRRRRAAAPDATGVRRWFPALAGALFFALHPLRVEPVAWLASRNDLLPTLFALLSLAAYMAMRRRAGPARMGFLGLSLAAFVAGLLCKAMVMTLPLVLLIVDAYPLRRFSMAGPTRERAARILAEKVPYLLVAAVFSGVALVAKGEAGELDTLGAHGLLSRLIQAAYGLAFYLWKTVLPFGLSPLYLLGRTVHAGELRYLVGLIADAVLLVIFAAAWRRVPAVTAAAAAYGVLLLPVLGLTQSGAQLVADRYTYLACLPWAVLLAAALGGRWDPRGRASRIAALAVVAVLVTLGALTHRQARVWDRVLEIEPDNYYAFQNRAGVHHQRNELALALDAALALRPEFARARVARGRARAAQGDTAGAVSDFTEIATDPWPQRREIEQRLRMLRTP